jgi:hypothetical protein
LGGFVTAYLIPLGVLSISGAALAFWDAPTSATTADVDAFVRNARREASLDEKPRVALVKYAQRNV